MEQNVWTPSPKTNFNLLAATFSHLANLVVSWTAAVPRLLSHYRRIQAHTLNMWKIREFALL
jgi:hypothetical protein